jgi:hypothetical protein
VACAHSPQARVDLKPEFGLEGAKEITVIAEQDDFERVEPLLKASGFQVRRWIDGVEGAAPPQTALVARVDGVCGVRGAVDPTLHFDVYKSDVRVFSAAATSPGGCPDPFYAEAITALNQLWKP